MSDLTEYVLDRLKLAPEVARRILEAERWADHGDGQPCLMAHEWAGDGGERHCTGCGLTYQESWGRPGTGHLACLGRPVR